jgi:hypothetical protein
MLMRISAVAFIFMMCILPAAEADQLGVAVYPGAKYDFIRTSFLAENQSIQGAAYRTSDNLAKVIVFYRKQGLLLLKIGSPSKEHARFKNVENNVDVVIQQPWKDPQTGATMNDTLILILKEKEQGGQ